MPCHATHGTQRLAVNHLFSTEASTLVQEMATKLGPAMDPIVELFMQDFIKLSASTKKINVTLADATVATLIAHTTCDSRTFRLWSSLAMEVVYSISYVNRKNRRSYLAFESLSFYLDSCMLCTAFVVLSR